MMNIPDNPCPCCSGDTYEKCCKPFHEGNLPETALQLMRSRFTAYVFDIPDYIIKTTHPANPQYSENTFSWKRNISQFSRSSVFNKLEILDFKAQETFATVIFTAYITQNDHDCTFTEKSLFEKFQGRWLYRGGQLAEGHAPNLVTTGQLKVLPLAYYGDPILRRKADPVVDISEDIKKLVEKMVETMGDGVGIAAPQVHHSIRLFVIRTPIETDDGKYVLGEVKVFINPKISSPSVETWKTREDCLSIPTIHADVERPKEITVEFVDLEGIVNTQRLSGWKARLILHGNDHLDGVLFIDHLDSEERAKLEPILQKLKTRIHDGTEPRALEDF